MLIADEHRLEVFTFYIVAGNNSAKGGGSDQFRPRCGTSLCRQGRLISGRSLLEPSRPRISTRLSPGNAGSTGAFRYCFYRGYMQPSKRIPLRHLSEVALDSSGPSERR